MGRDPAIPYAEELDELEARFPGWQFWAIPRGHPVTTDVVWCARPLPLINAGSPEELAERIRDAHAQPPYGSPSLASWRSYRARVRALRKYEDTATAAWEQRKAQQAARSAAGPTGPVERFYRQHGRPDRTTTPYSGTEAGGESARDGSTHR